jgi:hypothetical protein
MKNINFNSQEKYNDNTKFEKISEGIYKSLYDYENDLVKNGQYVTSISFTLEEKFNEISDRQYPLEDILDKFFAHVSEFIQDDINNPIMIVELCTQNWLDKMEELVSIIDKNVYNKEEIIDGKTYVKLVIE